MKVFEKISELVKGDVVELRNGGILTIDRVEDRQGIATPCLRYAVYVPNLDSPIAYDENGHYHASVDHPFDIMGIVTS